MDNKFNVETENHASDFEDGKSVDEEYSKEDRKQDNKKYPNYKRNDTYDWYLNIVKFLNPYADKMYNFFSSTNHGILYSFLASGIISSLTSLIFHGSSLFPRGIIGAFSSGAIFITSFIFVPLINYFISRFVYLFTKKYMRPTPEPCTRDIKGGVFSIFNSIVMIILTPLGLLGSILGLLVSTVTYSASFFDITLEKDSFNVGAKALLAQIIIRVVLFIIEMIVFGIIGLLIFGTFKSLIS